MARPPLRRRHLRRAGSLPRIGNKVPNSSPARLELEKKLAHKPIGQRANDSDDSDRLVVKGNGRRGRNIPKLEIFASGAVGKGDKPGNYPSRAQRRESMTQATNDILARTRQNARRHNSSDSATKQPPQRSPLPSGDANEATGTQYQRSVSAQISSSSVKPPASILRSAQPTPTRETSILGTLKPRRRQPSILQVLEHDSSTLDLEDEARFLPDAESTPLNITQSRNVSSTPLATSPPVSSSRKRKLSSADKFRPSLVGASPKSTSLAAATSRDTTGTPEPSLPPVARSALPRARRTSQEKVGDTEDVMALPKSSSSLSSSPVIKQTPSVTKKSKKKVSKPAPTMATEELQALLMPRKRRRTARAPTRPLGDFNIAPDSDIYDSEHMDPLNGEDESNFLPAKKGRNPRRRAAAVKPVTAPKKARGGTRHGNVDKQGGSTATTITSKSNTSTRHLIAIKASVAPSTATSTRWNHSTKSPLQLSADNSSTLNSKRAIKQHQRNQGTKSKSLGGSHRGDQDPLDGADKENFDTGDGSLGEYAIKDRQAEQLSAEIGNAIKDKLDGGKSKTASKGKWADIDAWDLDFEEVEVTTGSSSPDPMRR